MLVISGNRRQTRAERGYSRDARGCSPEVGAHELNMRANRPSHTAAKISRGMSYLGHTEPYASVLPAGAAEWTEELGLACGIVKPWMIRLYQSRFFARVAEGSSRVILPGQLLGSALRKRFVNDGVEQGIRRGASQVLLVGGGFDPLCLRLARKHPSVHFIEVDHPATMAVKKHGAEQLGPLAGNLELASVDLGATPLGEALGDLNWDPTRRSVVVAEGVLMYLDLAAVVVFLENVHRSTGAESELVLTLVSAEAPAWLRASVALVGERIRWTIEPVEVSPFLRAHGFEVVEGSADLRTTYLAGTELADAPLSTPEHVVAALRVGEERPLN